MINYEDSQHPHVKSNPISFLTDLGISLVASLACLLYMRYSTSAVPGFDYQLIIWLHFSLVATTLSLMLTRVNRILFYKVSFSHLCRILLFLLFKGALMFFMIFCVELNMLWDAVPLRSVVMDMMFTGVFYSLFKILIVCYYSYDGVSIESAVRKVNVVIYGTGSQSLDAASRFSDSSNYHLVGFLTRDGECSGRVLMGLPVFFISDNTLPVRDISAILFAVEADRLRESSGIIVEASKRGIFVLTLPETQCETLPGLSPDEIDHQLDDQFIVDNMSSVGRAFKRIVDLFMSSLLIIILGPLMLTITVVMLISEGHPVIYRQERIGRFGRPFKILKFRSMRPDSEDGGPALYAGDDDPRLTRIGRFLRIHHLDELPQLFNVFVGDMSFVGYRPERKFYIKQIIKHDPRYSYLYQMRPGVTSYATIKNGYTDTMEKMLLRLKYDLYYLNHRSLLFDAKVIFDTVVNVISGKRF